MNGGRCIPVEADAHTLTHAPRTHTRLTVDIPRVECQAHDLEVRLAPSRSLERIKLVYFVHLRVKKSFFGIGQSLYERGISHVRINLLNDQSFGTLAFVLVRPLALHLLLPFLFALEIITVPLADVLQDMVDRFADAVLARTRTRHEAAHQRGFMLHIVDIAEVRFPQMCAQRREDCMRYRRLVNLRCAAHQQFDERRQASRHLRRLIEFRVLSYKFLFFTFFANGKYTLHDARHLLRLVAVARTANACQPFISCFAVGG